MVSLNLKPRFNKTRCPYCHDDLSGELVECNSCSASHHSECWDELQVCAACSRGNYSLQNIRIAAQNLDFPELRTASGFLAFTFEVILFLCGLLSIIIIDGFWIIVTGILFMFSLLFELIGGLISLFYTLILGLISLFSYLIGLFMQATLFCLPLLFTIAIVLKLMGVW